MQPHFERGAAALGKRRGSHEGKQSYYPASNYHYVPADGRGQRPVPVGHYRRQWLSAVLGYPDQAGVPVRHYQFLSARVRAGAGAHACLAIPVQPAGVRHYDCLVRAGVPGKTFRKRAGFADVHGVHQ